MRTLIISHKADADGLTPVILINLLRENAVSNLLNANDINPRVEELIKTKEYERYDEIFITDLTLSKKSCEMIMTTGCHEKFHTFDHHALCLVANDYPFGTAISTNSEGVNECATSLFYKYLLKEYPEIYDTDALKTFTELVRQIDTWDWAKTNNLDAKKVSDLQGILSKEEFINNYTKFFKENKTFYFTEKEQYLLDVEDGRIQRYMEDAEKTMFHAVICGHPCGIVFAEQHRSLLGNYLAEKYSHMIDFVVIINMQQGISLRSISDKVNVGEIATIYGGGGHVKAAGAPMDNSLKKEVIKLILNDNAMFDK